MKFCALISASGVFFSILLLALHISGICSGYFAVAFLPYLVSLLLLSVFLPWQVNQYQDNANDRKKEDA